jgi:DNA mismatch repair protein MSH6
LKDKNIKDVNMNSPDSPDYDPTTLYIPKDEWAKFTPAMVQYWQIK